MRQLTLSEVRAVVAPSINLCSTDERVVSYINRAQERMMAEGDWLGTWALYRICVNSSCLSWPRPIERITMLNICDQPVPVRNQWYEFIENGPGYTKADNTCAPWQGIDQNQSPLFSDITSTAKKVKVYADYTEAVGAKILLKGFDANYNWIQTTYNGSLIEGEYVTISASTPAVSTKYFAPPGPQIVIKPVTNGPVRLYSYDDTVSPVAQAPIAVYEGGETNPIYRRTKIPNLARTSDDECLTRTVTALVKLRHIDVVSDNDTLTIQSREAFRLACQSIRQEENGFMESSLSYMYGFPDPVTRRRKGGAIGVLQSELDNYLGAGAINPIRYEPACIAGASVYNPM